MSIFKKIFNPISSVFSNNSQPEFIAIGDIVIDAFIKLKDAHETQNITTGSTELCMVFGTKLPFEFAEEVVAVGNSANAAVAAARLGLGSGLVAHIGKDENGQKCLRQLEKEGVSTRYIGVHPGLITNYHYVLWFGSERTILIKHEDFPLSMPRIKNPEWMYLSSLGEHSLPFHKTIADFLAANPETRLVFQPGTYQIKFGTEALKDLYKRTELFFCNLEEAELILGIKAPQYSGNTETDATIKDTHVKDLLAKLKMLGPKLPIITDGPHGSFTYIARPDAAGNLIEHIAHLPIYPDIAPPKERTGAGDAFASTFSSAIALGENVETALKWGSINSMNVCQEVGAQKGLLTREKIDMYIKSAPANWQIRVF